MAQGFSQRRCQGFSNYWMVKAKQICCQLPLHGCCSLRCTSCASSETLAPGAQPHSSLPYVLSRSVGHGLSHACQGIMDDNMRSVLMLSSTPAVIWSLDFNFTSCVQSLFGGRNSHWHTVGFTANCMHLWCMHNLQRSTSIMFLVCGEQAGRLCEDAASASWKPRGGCLHCWSSRFRPSPVQACLNTPIICDQPHCFYASSHDAMLFPCYRCHAVSLPAPPMLCGRSSIFMIVENTSWS